MPGKCRGGKGRGAKMQVKMDGLEGARERCGGDRWTHAVKGVVFDPVTGEGVGHDIETGAVPYGRVGVKRGWTLDIRDRISDEE